MFSLSKPHVVLNTHQANSKADYSERHSWGAAIQNETSTILKAASFQLEDECLHQRRAQACCVLQWPPTIDITAAVLTNVFTAELN